MQIYFTLLSDLACCPFIVMVLLSMVVINYTVTYDVIVMTFAYVV